MINKSFAKENEVKPEAKGVSMIWLTDLWYTTMDRWSEAWTENEKCSAVHLNGEEQKIKSYEINDRMMISITDWI